MTGYRIDLNMLGEFCRANGIILAVDAIQGLGALKLDAEKTNIDFISCGTQKWLMGLKGFSFIYLSGELQERIQPVYVGWLSVENAWDLLNYDMKLKQDASVFEGGTMNIIGAAAFGGALDLFYEFGLEKTEDEVLANSIYLRERLNEIGIKTIGDGWNRGNMSGIITFPHPKAKEIFGALQEREIIVSLREGMIRVSPHFYNTFEEIDGFISTLCEIVAI